MSKSWASTVKLPSSTFPPRPNPKLTNQYIRRSADDFYRWQAAHRPQENEFILHDGPPYANGDLHAGHALNKVLKDIINRVKVQQGRRVNYKPGWDCHGLPIELKALGASRDHKSMTALEIRKAARDLALTTVDKQMKAFRSYAVMADWQGRYQTMDKDFELRQLRLFRKMVSRGLIYRKFKPVYWSPSSGTALAEAELEYNDTHISHAAYVKFRVVDDWRRTLRLSEGDVPEQLYALIWTTTPWTLPANRAIAVHDDLDYCVALWQKNAYIVAQDCLQNVAKVCFGTDDYRTLRTLKGSLLRQLRYVHVLRGKDSPTQPIIHAPFVSADSGSGLVHCAPGHGFEDYEVCLPLGIEVAAPVDKDGNFTADAFPPDPSRLEGKSIFSEGSRSVVELLGPDVMQIARYKHKYPYDWRTKKPIIIRATAQWFADVAHIKDSALRAIEEVRFVPESGKSRLEAFVKGRSEWCISRQRAWGVPIPALYNKSGDAVMTEDSLDHIIGVIEERGTDAWWSDPAEDPVWIAPSLRNRGGYVRGTDTMDVWFDSGSSWTLSNKQADVYLEGSDQHRGWFQSSLLTRVAALVEPNKGVATTEVGLSPFKTLVTHGFTLDAKGKKMSKSLGNIVPPEALMDGSILDTSHATKARKGSGAQALGPDALRFWVASSDYTKDVVLSPDILRSVNQSLGKYRVLIKMMLGSIEPQARTLPLTTLDRIALIQLEDAMTEVGRLYDSFEFQKVVSVLNRWLVKDVSAFYMDALKDRLYTVDGGGVLEPIFFGLMRMLAPITPLLVEEAWDHAPAWLKKDPAISHPLHQLYSDPLIDPSHRLTGDLSHIRKMIPAIMSAHAATLAAMELARQGKVLGSSVGCRVVIEVPADSEARRVFESLQPELASILVVSDVEITTRFVPDEVEWLFKQPFLAYGDECHVCVLPPTKHKCPRCWRYVADKEDDLCGRCVHVVAKLEQQPHAGQV